LPGSVHTAYFPKSGELTDGIGAAQRQRVENWQMLIAVRDEVQKGLETARQEKIIGAPLEARVQLSADSQIYPLLTEYSQELPGLFIVSEVELHNHAAEGVKVSITRATGTKCERCWKYTGDVGSDSEVPTVCAACASAIRDSEADA
jgi:isoleucyl-tRNA synthetase